MRNVVSGAAVAVQLVVSCLSNRSLLDLASDGKTETLPLLHLGSLFFFEVTSLSGGVSVSISEKIFHVKDEGDTLPSPDDLS